MADRTGLVDFLGNFTDERFGGRIEKRYLTLLRLAYHQP
jgi:hypothetical protein